MMKIPHEQLKERLKAVTGRRVNVEDVLLEAEKANILQTTRNLFDMNLGPDTSPKLVSRYVDEGRLNFIVAIDDLDKDASGKRPFLVYDPAHRDFRSIEALYDEAITGGGSEPPAGFEQNVLDAIKKAA
ncbi:MAG: hypothetical protein HY221_00725 [Candidatus Sungbacteria bacterium]|uniref:Uncharacterized protein n=1 Tax=Candidatus Sungiibacteriota bacterium TaxID=2750080 RepID=A0A932R1C8_9BACT|nr:hypothetical protein [Candidatus Sungbacteria bacterium]